MFRLKFKVHTLSHFTIIAILAASTSLPVAAGNTPTDTHAENTWDAPDADKDITLDELQVTASLASMASAGQARIVTVIPREEILALPATSIPDILKMTSGVDVRQRGGFGVQADISLDGGTYDQVSILLNGVNITSSQTGHYSADWPVDVEDIERIEIIEGAASRYAGGSSLMGAINIVTLKADSTGLTLKIDGGSYGTIGAAAKARLAAGSFTQSISGGYHRSDGGTTNSEFSRGRVFYQCNLNTEVGKATFQAGFSDISHGANTFYSGAYPNQHDALRRYIVSASGATNGKINVEPMIYWQRTYDHFQLIHNSNIGENFHRTDAWGGKLNASTLWKLGRTSIGGEARRESIISSNMGQPIPDLAADARYKFSDARTALSFNAEHIVELGRVNASAGVVAAMNTGYDRKFRFYPGVDLSWTPSHTMRFFATWGRSFRMPTFTDLFYKAPTHQGNRDLKPEQMQSWQAGLQITTAPVSARVNAFLHNGHNMIDWVMYHPDDVFHATGFNLDNMGFSLSCHIRLKQLFGENQPLDYLDMGYTYMHQHRHDAIEIYESRSALEYLKHKFTANLGHRLWKNASATWSVRWQHRMGDFLLYENGVSQGRLEPYRPYATLDLKIDWQATNRLKLNLQANNLTNHRYYDCANIPQPGLWIMAGISLTI